MLAHALVAPPCQVAGGAVESLLDILRDDVNLAVWQRQCSAQIQTFATAVLDSGVVLAETFTWSRNGQGDDDDVRLPGLLGNAQQMPGHAEFVSDVAYLTSLFACLVDARSVGIRLRTLDKPMCPRWHVDKVPVRLITSYAGPGSEWLEEQYSPREQLGSPAVDPYSDQGAAQVMACGEVALMKGERWQGNEGRGLVHRSPALSAGQRRLILTLDWLD